MFDFILSMIKWGVVAFFIYIVYKAATKAKPSSDEGSDTANGNQIKIADPRVSTEGGVDNKLLEEMIEAVKSEDAARVHQLLENGFNPNALEPPSLKGESAAPVFWGAHNPWNFNIFVDFVNHGANPFFSAPGEGGLDMLFISTGSLSHVQYLLTKGHDGQGVYKYHMIDPLRDAFFRYSKYKNENRFDGEPLQIIEELLKYGFSPSYRRSPIGNLFSHCGIKFSTKAYSVFIEIIKDYSSTDAAPFDILLKFGADVNDSVDNNLSCLSVCVLNENPDVRTSLVKYFLAHGADGGTALAEMAFYGKLREVDCLRSLGVDVNARSKTHGQTTALIAAAQAGNIEIVQYLITCGAKVNLVADSGKTAFAVASANNHDKVAKVLADAGGRDVGSDPNAHEDELYGAVYEGRFQWILEHADQDRLLVISAINILTFCLQFDEMILDAFYKRGFRIEKDSPVMLEACDKEKYGHVHILLKMGGLIPDSRCREAYQAWKEARPIAS